MAANPRIKSSLLSALVIALLFPALRAHGQQLMKEIDPSIVDITKLPDCIANAPARYPKGPDINGVPKDKGSCKEDIHREAAVSPPPLILHAGTRVFVRIYNPRPNETLQPVITFAHLAPPDIGTDVLKNAINPLQTITLSPVVHGGVGIKSLSTNTDKCDMSDKGFEPYDCQAFIADTLIAVQKSINLANSALTCLEHYQVAAPFPAPAAPDATPPPVQKYSCSAPIDPSKATSEPNSFAKQNALAKKVIDDANVSIPTYRLSQLDSYLTNQAAADMIKCKGTAKGCKDIADQYDAYQANEGKLKASATAIQSSQATLQQTLAILNQFPDTADMREYYFDVPSLTSATVTISGVEVVSKTSSAIATWTTSPTSFYFVFSTGLGFSNIVLRTYANTPQVQNGKPVLNSSGNALSMVTESDTKLSVIAPEVMGSLLIPGLSKIEDKCSFGCSLLVSGGIGANLTMKSADFDTGISVRLGNFLVTPAVHFGRESRLIDGITVDSQLGAGAPSTLPTQNKWVRKLGVVFTYVIPLS
jgi:hypothetical protein